MNVNRELVRELRINNAWSQEKLAEEAGVSLRTVQRMENEGIASLQTRSAIAQSLGVRPSQLSLKLEGADARPVQKATGYQIFAHSIYSYYALFGVRLCLLTVFWLLMAIVILSMITMTFGGIFFWELAEIPELTAPQAAGSGILSSILIAPFFFVFRWGYRTVKRTQVLKENLVHT